MPDTVKKISNKAFQNIWDMTSVIIPDTVTEIGKEAFEGCSDLISVTIPAGVKKYVIKLLKTALN
ncbi:leucine-rich repeat protein [uncultured Ruminococcus sp.]|uniref:leucine-rich repeat protein n=1 Tax=uncultured Ruminococcus sp. TaxID=165186 RepID=UPI00345C1DC4